MAYLVRSEPFRMAIYDVLLVIIYKLKEDPQLGGGAVQIL